VHFCAGETGVVVGGASHRPDSGGDISGDGIKGAILSGMGVCTPFLFEDSPLFALKCQYPHFFCVARSNYWVKVASTVLQVSWHLGNSQGFCAWDPGTLVRMLEAGVAFVPQLKGWPPSMKRSSSSFP
jgi:hypothetical protein